MRAATRPWRRLAMAAAGAAVIALAGHELWMTARDNAPSAVPSCSWPLRVQGTATHEQAGLIRCYLSALARRDTAGLQAVADNNPPVRITGADLRHSADARAGTATATFMPNAVDGAYLTVTIGYADGAKDSISMALANPGSAHSWRVQIGTDASNGGAPPPPAS